MTMGEIEAMGPDALAYAREFVIILEIMRHQNISPEPLAERVNLLIDD